MPINGRVQSKIYPQYFESLEDLDEWSKSSRKKLDGILTYTPRRTGQSTSPQGKLLVTLTSIYLKK